MAEKCPGTASQTEDSCVCYSVPLASVLFWQHIASFVKGVAQLENCNYQKYPVK